MFGNVIPVEEFPKQKLIKKMSSGIYKRSLEQRKKAIKNLLPFHFKTDHKALGKPFKKGHGRLRKIYFHPLQILVL